MAGFSKCFADAAAALRPGVGAHQGALTGHTAVLLETNAASVVCTQMP